jgi:hypothetical protein
MRAGRRAPLYLLCFPTARAGADNNNWQEQPQPHLSRLHTESAAAAKRWIGVVIVASSSLSLAGEWQRAHRLLLRERASAAAGSNNGPLINTTPQERIMHFSPQIAAQRRYGRVRWQINTHRLACSSSIWISHSFYTAHVHTPFTVVEIT